MKSAGSDFETLGIGPGAPPELVRRAYRQLAKKYHPDVNPGGQTEEDFKRVQEAYDRLTTYQSSGMLKVDRTDVQVVAYLTLDDALFGCAKQITFDQFSTCSTCLGRGASGTHCQGCQGRGTVVETTLLVHNGRTTSQPHVARCPSCGGRGATTLCPRCHGQGATTSEQTITVHLPPTDYRHFGLTATVPHVVHPRDHLSLPGHLHLLVQLVDHADFTPMGRDLVHHRRVPFQTFLFGGTLRIDYFGRRQVDLIIPAKMDPGSAITIPGLGFPGPVPGDLVVRLGLALPQSPADIRALVEDLQNGCTSDSHPERPVRGRGS